MSVSPPSIALPRAFVLPDTSATASIIGLIIDLSVALILATDGFCCDACRHDEVAFMTTWVRNYPHLNPGTVVPIYPTASQAVATLRTRRDCVGTCSAA